MFAEVLLGEGGVQAAEGVEDIQPPGLIEANGDIMSSIAKRGQALAAEAPRAQETRSAQPEQTVEVHLARQSRFVPLAGVQVDAVAIANEPAAEVGDIGFAAAASGNDMFETEGDVHETPSQAEANDYATSGKIDR